MLYSPYMSIRVAKISSPMTEGELYNCSEHNFVIRNRVGNGDWELDFLRMYENYLIIFTEFMVHNIVS